MITAKYDKNRLYDEHFERIIKDVSVKLNVHEDDFVMLCFGTTGTGKSMLGLHAEELYMGDEASVDYIGLNRSSFAHALKDSKEKSLPRFCMNDEANISKRDSLTKYNKDLIDLYLSIRGLRIFHWWNNPSVDMIDKHFIEERIKGAIFIATKEINRPRVYYYFRKRDLLRIWEKYGHLKLNLIKKIKKEYAYYKGWFKDYSGVLKQPYLQKKGERMDFKVDDFFDKYQDTKTEWLKVGETAKKVGVSNAIIIQYTKEMLEKHQLTDEDFKVSPTGFKYYHPSMIEKFIQLATEKKHRKGRIRENIKNARKRNKSNEQNEGTAL